MIYIVGVKVYTKPQQPITHYTVKRPRVQLPSREIHAILCALVLKHGSSVWGWTTKRYILDHQQGQEICLFPKMSGPTLGPKQLPIQRVSGAVSLGSGG